MTETPSVKFSMLTDHIGELVVCNPARRNALTAAMWASMPGILDGAAKTPGLRVLVVRGEGEHFAAGADISEFSTLYATPETSEKISLDIAAAFAALAEFPAPTIAMIRGSCVGGGCALSLCCDVRMADSTGKFAITPAKLGLVYPFSDVQRLIETVGIPNAKDLLLSARLIQAKAARKMGLINTLYKVDNLERGVMDYAENLTTLSPQSLKVTKQMFAAYQGGQFGDNAQTMEWFLSGFNSDDFQEGYSAFLEKRKPDFS
ncbi:MAG: enoyl-CoA hydratase/isomerase family protein [Maricaulaceae bacterium]